MGHSPRSGNMATFGMTTPISNTIPSSGMAMDDNAIAGPSHSGQGVGLTPKNYSESDRRRESQEEDM
jgi:hypothetical protein